MFNSPPANLQAALLAAFLHPPAAAQAAPGPDGVSAYGMDETVTRLRHDIADKGSQEQFAKAASVVESITSTIRAR